MSKVDGAENTYNVFGYEFRSPSTVAMNFVLKYMRGVVKEVLADEKVNEEGLNYLSRILEHP